MTTRRAFLGALAGGLGVAPLAAQAQQVGKVYRIGTMGEKAPDPLGTHLWRALRLGLRERGWIEGRNILIEFREAEGNLARLPELAADLVRLKVDLILAKSSIFVQPAKAATSSIPIVFVVHADPVGTGHVASLARPGGNITGLANLHTDLGPKGLELLSSAVPVAERIAVLWNPDTPSHRRCAHFPFGPRGSTVSGRHSAYWITSSARPSTDGGIVSPSALAVLRLITSSNLEACSTGRSAGLAPLRILST